MHARWFLSVKVTIDWWGYTGWAEQLGHCDALDVSDENKKGHFIYAFFKSAKCKCSCLKLVRFQVLQASIIQISNFTAKYYSVKNISRKIRRTNLPSSNTNNIKNYILLVYPLTLLLFHFSISCFSAELISKKLFFYISISVSFISASLTNTKKPLVTFSIKACRLSASCRVCVCRLLFSCHTGSLP